MKNLAAYSMSNVSKGVNVTEHDTYVETWVGESGQPAGRYIAGLNVEPNGNEEGYRVYIQLPQQGNITGVYINGTRYTLKDTGHIERDR